MASHNQQCVGRGTCINIETPKLLTTTEDSSIFTNQEESRTVTSVSIVGGILGFIIAVLVLLLLSIMTIGCLLRPNLTLRKYVTPKMRYTITLCHTMTLCMLLKFIVLCGSLRLLLYDCHTFSMDTCRRSTNPDFNLNTSSLPVERNLSYATIPSSLATSETYAEVGGNARQEDEPTPNYSRLGPAHETADLGRQQLEGSQNQISNYVSERYEFAEIHNMETDRQALEDEHYSHLKH